MKYFIYAVLFASVQGMLVQVDQNQPLCSNTNAVFWCTSELLFLNWEILSIREQFSAAFSFSGNRQVGTTEMKTLNSSQILAEVTFNNGSLLNATITIMKPMNLNGSTITCNEDTLTLKTPALGTLPVRVNLSTNEADDEIDIFLTFGRHCYYIQLDNNSWIPVTTVYTIPLENVTREIEVYVYPDLNESSTFIVGSCIFYDEYHTQRNYTLDINGTWNIFQECSDSKLHFATECNLGIWTVNKTCSSISTKVSTLSDSTRSISTTMEEAQDGSGLGTSIISAICIAVVIFILVVIATVIMLILLRRRRKKKSSNEYQSQALQLNGQGEYSSLHHSKPSVISAGAYDTVQDAPHFTTAKRNHLQYGHLETKIVASIAESSSGYSSTSHLADSKIKHLKYTDVDASGLNDHLGHNLIHIKVDYTDVNIPVRPEDQSLNLDSLLIQLNSISKDFRQFGSIAGISPEILDEISDSCVTPRDGLVEVCDAWLVKCHKEKTTPTWTAVAAILSQIGRDKMAEDIMQVYITGKLPIEVDMNSVNIQGAACLPTPPPPIPPHRDEDTSSEVELMTVTSVMTNRQSNEVAMDDEPPPIPERPLDLMLGVENEESQQALPKVPPKLPVKVQRKPLPAKRHLNKDDETIPSLPPRPPKNI